ncbi:MAG TPA: mechanosensitive ion channel domain-containing protein [Pirellulales bacterium]|nr:mechanosensitive ion channel domain-containing protein [Pirellulales bacterium]
MLRLRPILVGLCLSAIGWWAGFGRALADPTEAPATGAAPSAVPLPEVTAASLQAQIAIIKAATGLDEGVRKEVLANYQSAVTELDRAAVLEKQTEVFKQAVQSAPDRLRDVRATLEKPNQFERPTVPADASTAELETTLAETQDELSQAQDELTRLETEPQRRTQRRLQAIPQQLEAATKKLEEIEKQLSLPAGADEAKEMTAARQALSLARRQALNQEIACCTSERESYNAEDELLPKEHDLAERQVSVRKQLVEAWQKIIHSRRQRDAEAKLSTAKREKRQLAYPELRSVAEENEELARRVTKINNDVAAASKQTVDFTNAQSDLDREFKDVAKKADLGLAQQLGPYWLQCRIDLVRRRRELDGARVPQSLIDSVSTEWLSLVERRKKLHDLNPRTEEVLRGLDLSASSSPRRALEAETRRLLQTRRELVDSLVLAYERYIRELGTLMVVDKQLFDEIAGQLDYIDERILWVRSTARIGAGDLAASREAMRWLVRPQEWRAVGDQWFRGAIANVLACLLTGAVFVALLITQPRMRGRIRQLGDRAARGNADDMSLTVRTLILTTLVAAPWPLMLATLGSLGEHAPAKSELGPALAHGLQLTAIAVAMMEFLRQVCRSRGLGTAHFGWPEQSARLVRKQLRWFMPVMLPITLAAGTIHALDNDRWQAFGRLLFITAMCAMSVFLQRVLRPVGGVLHEFSAYHRGSWIDRLHRLAYPIVAGSPLALSVLAGLGYYYTARQLAWRFHATGWLLVAFLISGALLLRWLLIMRRRLAIRQARQRRAAGQHDQRGPDGAELPTVTTAGEGQLDLTTINLQTQRFVQTMLVAGLLGGLWLIWSDVLPALSILNVRLWDTLVEDADGRTQKEAIHVVRLLEAAIAVGLTMVATRNIPGLLEIVLLQRLPLEPATRYAITTLIRYAISVAGIVIACAALGITWAKVHWLVAAVSVGLGFGLQEIFANFISGLIILFERPIRVGDIVTVDDVSGVVSRIRIRATMITDFDRKELIVPNKEFITGRVLNWTLSDQMNRVTVNVGVAYGSDIDKACSLLAQAAAENPYILKEPAPMATFEGFGDSVLNLVLRCYLPNLENRMSVVHDLHSRIHAMFRDEGIDIAFPQLDLHIRTSPLAVYQRQAG